MVTHLDELLQQLQRHAHHRVVASIERCLDGNDELRNHRQDAAPAVLQQVLHALHRQEAVRLLALADAVEENGQVMVVIQLININLCVVF